MSPFMEFLSQVQRQQDAVSTQEFVVNLNLESKDVFLKSCLRTTDYCAG